MANGVDRDFQIFGPALVKVKFGSQVSGRLRQGPTNVLVSGMGISGNASVVSGSYVQELGMSDMPIDISLNWRHKNLHTDDFGPEVPYDLMWQLAEATIRMTLVHYDDYVLQQCFIESMGGGGYADPNSSYSGLVFPGRFMMPAGTLIGGNIPLYQSGCHYMSLSIVPGNLTNNAIQSGYRALPWRFLTCVLAEPPFSVPLGTQYSVTRLNWRAIPYGTYTRTFYESGQVPYPPTVRSCDIQSSGVSLFDHFADEI